LGRVRTDGKECTWPPEEDLLLAPFLLWSNEAAKSAALEKTSTVCCRECYAGSEQEESPGSLQGGVTLAKVAVRFRV